MAKIKICEKCKINKATVQISNYKNGFRDNVILCENCAKNYNDTNDVENTEFTKENFMSSLLDSIQNTGLKVNYIKTTKCDKCGMNYGKFKEIGRLGCDECYKTFEEKLIPLIQRLQGSTIHTGKVSKKVTGIMEIRREIAKLKARMDEVINSEKFEEAVIIRDKIKNLEKEITKSGGKNE